MYVSRSLAAEYCAPKTSSKVEPSGCCEVSMVTGGVDLACRSSILLAKSLAWALMPLPCRPAIVLKKTREEEDRWAHLSLFRRQE